ncbi:MAG TPA: acyl carrier protein [Anaerolineales bacterium]|nr:acyl carrier protein [Anaerolineales bacterium]
MTDETSKIPITFKEFQHMLADVLQMDENQLTPDASFVNDLMVDSIKLVELMLGLEENGINIPMEAAWDVQTVGDAYRVYQESSATSS